MRCEAYFFIIAVAIIKKYNNVRLFIIFVPNRFPEFIKYCVKFYYIIQIVLLKFSLSFKNSENFDVNEL